MLYTKKYAVNGGARRPRSCSKICLPRANVAGRNNLKDEVNRRIQLGWAAFGKVRRVFSSSISQSLKTKVFNQCVLPFMTYGAEMWTLTARLVHKVKVAQRAMKRAMLGVYLQGIRNQVIRQRTKGTDIVHRISMLK
jgi:hypothetical protein